MISRDISGSLLKVAEQVPVVTMIGPRQSGKTTLVKEIFPEYNYVNLKDPVTGLFAKEDYKGFFETFKQPLIIDEVQRVPELLSAIQVMVDDDRARNGRFILTGSHQHSLQKGISQSLAGRTALLTLLPLSMQELSKEGILDELSIDRLLITGFMPELYRKGTRKAAVYYRDYLNTYVEKDLREMLEIRNLDRFLRFLTLLAGRVGQVVNLSSMSGEVGVSSTTLSDWLSVLELSYIVYKLRPYFSNVAKRQIKSPKIYFTEIGLASYLLGIETENQANRDPLRGNLFENLIVGEVLKSKLNQHQDPNIYYFRTAKGVEVDLIVRREEFLYPFEIKTSMTANKSFSKNLIHFENTEENAKKPRIIYAGQSYPKFNGVEYVNFKESNKYLTD